VEKKSVFNISGFILGDGKSSNQQNRQYWSYNRMQIKEEIMKISANLDNQYDQHRVILTTNGKAHDLAIAPKTSGFGSSVNGAEFLCLALATCYCNDLYREATKRGIQVEQVQVEVDSKFGADGEPASQLSYRATVRAMASEEVILDLMQHTDRMAEIENTLRVGFKIALEHMHAISVT
jgi:uncharacterized OsmC-like protein